MSVLYSMSVENNYWQDVRTEINVFQKKKKKRIITKVHFNPSLLLRNLHNKIILITINIPTIPYSINISYLTSNFFNLPVQPRSLSAKYFFHEKFVVNQTRIIRVKKPTSQTCHQWEKFCFRSTKTIKVQKST